MRRRRHGALPPLAAAAAASQTTRSMTLACLCSVAGLAEDGDKQFITLPDPKSGGPLAFLAACPNTRPPARFSASHAAHCPLCPARLPSPAHKPCRHRPAAAGQPAAYLLAGGCLQEINWFKQQYSSWFIGERVLQGAPAALWWGSLACGMGAWKIVENNRG